MALFKVLVENTNVLGTIRAIGEVVNHPVEDAQPLVEQGILEEYVDVESANGAEVASEPVAETGAGTVDDAEAVGTVVGEGQATPSTDVPPVDGGTGVATPEATV